MYCKHCGQEVSNDSVVCSHCGSRVQEEKTQSVTNESKVWLGALLGVFTGLIGIVIGLLMFKDGTNDRITFIKGWLYGFIGSFVASIVLVVFGFLAIMMIVIASGPMY